MRRYLSSTIFIFSFLAAILAFHVVALYLHLYWSIWWIDIPMHLIGGFWIALTVFWFYRSGERIALQNDFDSFLFVIGAVAFGGILWEFHEFFYDVIFRIDTIRPGLSYEYVDTLKDLADDLLGGITAFMIMTRIRKS